MNEVTRLLERVSEGDAVARSALIEAVHRELQGRARGHLRRERSGHTLSATSKSSGPGWATTTAWSQRVRQRISDMRKGGGLDESPAISE